MANVFVALPVPAGDGVGAWVDTSGMGAEKTLSIDGGAFSGTLYIESSNDAQLSACPVDVASFSIGNAAPVDVVAVVQSMRVRRSGAIAPFGAPTVKVAATVVSSNVFGALAVPAADGTGAGLDLSAGGDINTINIVGPFSGQVFIDISTDAGVTWSPAMLAGLPGQNTNGSAVGTNILGVIAQVRVRRAGVLPGGAAPVVSAGSGFGAGGGGAATGAGSAQLAFSARSGAVGIPTTTFMANDSDVAGGSATPFRYPVPTARTFTALALATSVASPSTTATATLIRYPGGTGAGIATPMTCAVGGSLPAGTNAIDIAHPVNFAAGDAYDIQITQPATPEGPSPYSATLEQAVGGGSAGGVSSFNATVGAVTTAVNPRLTQVVAGTTTTLGQNITAEWPIATTRTFLLDPVNGNDANPGFSDVAGPWNPATQAKQTVGALALIIPRAMNGRLFAIVYAAAIYVDRIDVMLDGVTGYGLGSFMRCTGTNATAGAIAFADDANDRRYVGGRTAVGMFAAGYNPDAAATDTITCLQVGGGAVAFPAAPLRPNFCRIRWDINTTTVALRGTINTIIDVPGGSGVFQLNAAVTRVATDVFYIEDPGGDWPLSSLWMPGKPFTFIGTSAAGWTVRDGRFTWAFCQATTAGFAFNYVEQATFSASGNGVVVGGNRAKTSLATVGGSFTAESASFGTETTVVGTNPTEFAYGPLNCIGTIAALRGGALTADQTINIGGAGGTNVKIYGPGSALTLNGIRCVLGSISFRNPAVAKMIVALGVNDIEMRSFIDGTATDCCLDLTGADQNRINVSVAQTGAFGTLGQIKIGVSSTTATLACYAPWASITSGLGTGAGNLWDQRGNCIRSTTTGATNQPIAGCVPGPLGAVNESGVAIAQWDICQLGPQGLLVSLATAIKAQANVQATSQGELVVALVPVPNNTAGIFAPIGNCLPVKYDGPVLAVNLGQTAYLSPVTAGFATLNIPATPNLKRALGAATFAGTSFRPIPGDSGGRVTVPNGVVLVALGAFGPVGTAATPVRWVDAPDGAGGIHRWPSFT